ncbi:MAG: hypothetical protein WD314_10650 [Trueperaceae bacterium]
MRRRAGQLLAALLLLLLSGLPQVGISVSSLELSEERLQSVPVTRSLLLDKLLPESTSLTPPLNSNFPPLLSAPPAALSLPVPASHYADNDTHRPAWWLLDLMSNLYRHRSNYI